MNRFFTLAVLLPIVFVRVAWYVVTLPVRVIIAYTALRSMR